MLTVFLCATMWYYLDVLICVSVYINFYFLFSFLFILFSLYFLWILWSDSNKDKLQPTDTMKSKDESSEQRFGHVNATKRNSYLNIICIKLVTQ